MYPVFFDDHLKAEYRELFRTVSIAPAHAAQIDKNARAIVAEMPRYRNIGLQVGVPWYVVGVIHLMECGLRFSAHLHNGDPLTARTVHVPAKRPVSGVPPFSFEESALDALRLRHMDTWKDWSLPGLLYQFECYNGLGYRQFHPTVKSPYLWSMTNHYTHGKYVADGHFKEDTVSQQVGICAVLKRLVELGAVSLV